MFEMTVSVVVFHWWDEIVYEAGPTGNVVQTTTLRAFSDRQEAEAYLGRCRRRHRYGVSFGYTSGGISEKRVTIPNLTAEGVLRDASRKLWIVRVRKDHPRHSTVRSQDPYGVEGAFASRDEAVAVQASLERKAAESGDPTPLLEFGYLERMLELSDFDLSVYGDWLTDHGIMTLPDPARYQEGWERWLESLPREHLAALYGALHRFRFYEVTEVPFVFGDYREEQWEDWEKDLLPPGAYPGPDDIPF